MNMYKINISLVLDI